MQLVDSLTLTGTGLLTGAQIWEAAQNGFAKHNKIRFFGASLHGLKNTRTVMFYISVNHRHASQRNFHYQISFLIMSANAEYCRT